VSEGNPGGGGGLNTVDLLINAACYVTKVNSIFKKATVLN